MLEQQDHPLKSSKGSQKKQKTIKDYAKDPFIIAPKDSTPFHSHLLNRTSTKNFGEPSTNPSAKSRANSISDPSRLTCQASLSLFLLKAEMAGFFEEQSTMIRLGRVKSSRITVFRGIIELMSLKTREICKCWSNIVAAVSYKYQITDTPRLNS